MSIIRIIKDKDNPYVMISKRVINNPDLSFKAKGIFTYLMSKPDNWTCQVTDITKHGTDGKASIYSALKELRENGYMIKQPLRNAKGIITSWEELIFENPSDEAMKIYKEQLERRKKKKVKFLDSDDPLSENQNEEINPVTENKKLDGNSLNSPLSENRNMANTPVAENKKLDDLEENPQTTFQDVGKLDMAEPVLGKCEILISNDDNNNNYNNNNYNKEIDHIHSFDDIKRKLASEISDASMNTWINPLSVVKFTDEILLLKAPNNFTKDILESRYISIIESFSGVSVEVLVDTVA